jgi:hypothetical protein
MTTINVSKIIERYDTASGMPKDKHLFFREEKGYYGSGWALEKTV